MSALKDTLVARKERIEERLQKFGITWVSISYLRYLLFDDKTFATPYEAGCRILIIYAVVYAIEEPSKKEALAQWLKQEKIWKEASYGEQQFLEGGETGPEQIHAFSWQLDAAYMLAWSLNLVKEAPSPLDSVTDGQMEDFFENVAPLGDNLDSFLKNLSYRNTEEIFEENIFYELTTAYFRDLLFNGKEDTTHINRAAAFERHKALNWLRRYMSVKAWEDTDTST